MTSTDSNPRPSLPEPPAERPVGFRQAFALATLAGRSGVAALLALAIVQGALPLVGLLAMQRLVDAVAVGMNRPGTGDGTAARNVTIAVLLAAAVAVLGNVLRAFAAVLAEDHGRRLADASTARLQRHAAAVDLAEVDRPAYHDLLQRAAAEAGTRPVRLVQDLVAFAAAVTAAVVMALALATVEPWLPLVAGVAAVPLAWTRRRHGRLRFAWHRDRAAEQREVGYLGAVLTGRATAKDVRALRLLPWVSQRLEALRGSLRGSLQALARRRAWDELLVHTIAGAALFGVYWHLGHAALAGALSIGGLVLHAQAAQRTQNAVRDLLLAWNGIGEDRLFLAAVVAFAGLPRRVVATPPVAVVPPGPVGIDAASLEFTYPEGVRPVLGGLTFRVAPGERVAVVGVNGSGKSTLLKLLCRLYDPRAGVLRMNGVDLRHVDPELWQARVACLFQDAAAFEATIAENLRLGAATSGDDAIARALAAVGLAERIRGLPLGPATPLSRRLPGGVELSAGELRRLLLARTLAQPASLVLLDEPFAHLDGAAVAAVAAAIASVPRDRTVVVVDHRAVAARGVDRVLLLDAGCLVANGSPAELAAAEPRFRRLFPEW